MLQTIPHCIVLAAIALPALPAVGQTVNETAKLLPSDGAWADEFGWSVAVSGTTALVGARRDRDNGLDSGSAYLFDTTTGQQTAKLLPDDGAAEYWFGFSVAISGTMAVVGAFGDSDNGALSGAAFLFDTTTGQQIAKILPDDGSVEDNFGFSIAFSGTTIIVGAIGGDINGDFSGSAYVFDATTGQQIAKLLPSDGAEQDWFGESVAISGTTAIVGSVYDDDNGNASGSAYLFNTTTGQQIAKLLPDDGAAEEWFGESVAISGTTALVGARWDDENGTASGAAYLFDTITGQQIAKLLPDDGVVGGQFGRSVAFSGDTALVGASGDNDNGEFSGSAYLFDATTGQQIVKLLPSDGAERDKFGVSVALSGTTVVVGAYFDDENGTDSGSAYVFTPSFCPADLTGDDEVDFLDISAFLDAFANTQPLADLNGDGFYDFLDISDFLTAFAAGCP